MPANPPKRKKPADHIAELKILVVGYAKQETIDPLKTLGRYLGFGLGGAFLVGGGSLFLLLGILRLMQSISPFEHDTGALSLVPYGVTLVAGFVIIGLAVWGILRGDPKKGSAK